MNKLSIILLLILSSTSGIAEQSHLAQTHAPIGVMGDHTHHAGEWMASLRTMNMSMDGLRTGGDDLTTAAALTTFMVVPLEMDMQMNMLGLMYAPTDRVTLMAMLNHQRNEMIMQTRMGNRFRTSSEGMGDTQLAALVNLFNQNDHLIHLNVGISLPTGSINPRDATPMGTNSLLPYPMRLSSGTHDLKCGVTWNKYHVDYALGAQFMSTIRTGENDQNYRLGHENMINVWAARSWHDSWSFSARLEAKNRQSIKGMDDRLTMMTGMTPTVNADFSGGDFLSIGLGINFVSNAQNKSRGHRLALELTQPLLQDLAGTQMKADTTLTLGWQKAF